MKFGFASASAARARRRVGTRAASCDIGIVYADDTMVVASKPGSMLMHRNLELTRGKEEKYLVDELRKQLADKELYTVHRLDRATSGIVVFGRSPEDAKQLQIALSSEEAAKTYIALAKGATPSIWTNDNPLTDHDSRKKVRRDARTDFRTLLHLPVSRLSLVHAMPKTGRRNQIRRHLSNEKHHIIGDVKFGKGRDNTFMRNRYGLPRLFLHARRLTLRHPVTGELITLDSPLPPDLLRFLVTLPDFSPYMHMATADTGHTDLRAIRI